MLAMFTGWRREVSMTGISARITCWNAGRAYARAGVMDEAGESFEAGYSRRTCRKIVRTLI